MDVFSKLPVCLGVFVLILKPKIKVIYQVKKFLTGFIYPEKVETGSARITEIIWFRFSSYL